MSDKGIGEKVDPPKAQPGDGIRSLRSTTLFRVVNYELYAKPNIVIMSIGLAAFGLALGYVAYMRSKYEGMGYYSAVQDDGSEVFVKKRSKWEN
ncbi:small integral membrane protein 8 [Hermetia illucens]|uniref:small integral membrane protein 8 n=1 Tax=Hermetia illucens TaxID=343691 RepID=UPI0018CC372A|nr:small integral membrane protein 8 [Hermetia illucens]